MKMGTSNNQGEVPGEDARYKPAKPPLKAVSAHLVGTSRGTLHGQSAPHDAGNTVARIVQLLLIVPAGPPLVKTNLNGLAMFCRRAAFSPKSIGGTHTSPR